MLSVALETIEKHISEAKSTEQDFVVMPMEEAEIIVAILKKADTDKKKRQGVSKWQSAKWYTNQAHRLPP